VVKTFYCAEDIERLAAQGQRELVVGSDTVLTDLARDRARQLEIRLVHGAQASVQPTASPGPTYASAPAAPLGAKPRGCQHGPVRPASASQGASNRAGPVVDQLVHLVRQMGKDS
jgi:hypothetical protein